MSFFELIYSREDYSFYRYLRFRFKGEGEGVDAVAAAGGGGTVFEDVT